MVEVAEHLSRWSYFYTAQWLEAGAENSEKFTLKVSASYLSKRILNNTRNTTLYIYWRFNFKFYWLLWLIETAWKFHKLRIAYFKVLKAYHQVLHEILKKLENYYYIRAFLNLHQMFKIYSPLCSCWIVYINI